MSIVIPPINAFMAAHNGAVMAGLQTAGEHLKRITRAELLKKYNASSNLVKSVDYLTKGPTGSGKDGALQGSVQGKASQEMSDPAYRLPMPSRPASLLFGVGAPYAYYVMNAAGRHTGKTGAALPGTTFEDNMMEWGERYNINESVVLFLIDHIRKEGTSTAYKFMPTPSEFEKITVSCVQAALKILWSSTRLPTIRIKV